MVIFLLDQAERWVDGWMDGGKHDKTECKTLSKNGLKQWLIFESDRQDLFEVDMPKPNKCIFKITNGKPGHTWKGPVTVHKVEEIIFTKFHKILSTTTHREPSINYVTQ